MVAAGLRRGQRWSLASEEVGRPGRACWVSDAEPSWAHRAVQGLAGRSDQAAGVFQPPRGRLRVTDEGALLSPGDGSFWNAPPSATDVMVPEVPCPLRAGCGAGLGGRGPRAPAALPVAFWSLLLKGRP